MQNSNFQKTDKLNKSHLVQRFLLLLLFPAMSAIGQQADADDATSFRGDVGVGVHHAPDIVTAASDPDQAIPYANFDYGRLFARIDMFGVRTVQVGYGNIELLTRVLDEGYTRTAANGAQEKRQSSIPIGVGTLQITPLGGFMFNVYRDVNQSKGTMADFLFAEEFDTGNFSLYPQVGVEYRSADYVDYYYGVSPAVAAQTMTTSYTPGDAIDPLVALFVEIKITGNWYLNADIRKLWLDKSIYNSPIVGRHSATSGLVALSYRF
jgi:outer membrane protein